MGLYDRDYTQEGYRQWYRSAPQMHFGFPRMTQAVKTLMVINVAVFLLGTIFFPPNIPFGVGRISQLDVWFSVFPHSVGPALQVWRLVTYQFLHGGLWHIAINMWVLYMFGPVIERHWGAKRFTWFYLGCGVAGGLLYTVLGLSGYLPAAPMVGASGAILGVLGACAILFPQMRIMLFPFPIFIPIRVGAIAGVSLFLFYVVTKGPNAGGHAAHLAGMVAGGAYVLTEKWRTNLKLRLKAGRWEKNVEQQRRLHIEVDRILKKVHDHGIQSLTPAEKRALKKATRLEQSHPRL